MSAARKASDKLLSLALSLNELAKNEEVIYTYSDDPFEELGEGIRIIDKMISAAYELEDNSDVSSPKSVVHGRYFAIWIASEYDYAVRDIFLGYRLDGHYHAEQIAALCLLYHGEEASSEGDPEYMNPIVKAILRCASEYQSQLMEVAA